LPVGRTDAGRLIGQSVIELKEYPDRSHFTVGQEGWEEVADYALAWSTEKASKAAETTPHSITP
jgi:hypothetical protein